MPVGYANSNDTNTSVTNDENGEFQAKIETIMKTLLSFVIAGIVWALSGFFKIKDPKQDTFDPTQFFTTVVVGGVTGMLAFVIGEIGGPSIDFGTIWGYMLAVGVVAFVETWMKVIWRRVKPYFAPPAETARPPHHPPPP